MKCLTVILIILLILLILTIRYRRQIQLSLYIFRLLFAIRKNETHLREEQEIRFVCCVGCKKWLPASEAIDLQLGNFYCSKECLNKRLH